MKRKRVSVILLAGGSGSRFGAARPKQLVELAGRPVLAYSVRRFCQWLGDLDTTASFQAGNLVLVSHPDYADECLVLAERVLGASPFPLPASFAWKERLILAEGGQTRHLSSVNGVRAAGPAEMYVIHDTARPYVPVEDLNALVAAFDDGKTSVASLVVASNETLVEGRDDCLVRGLDRSQIYAVKTPQAFRSTLLDRFLEAEDRPEYTDLLRWAELQGLPARLVQGSALNLKLTRPEDRLILEAVLHASEDRA